MAKNRNAGAVRAEPEIFNGALLTPCLAHPWPGQGGIYIGTIRGTLDQPDYCIVMPPWSAQKLKAPWGPDGRVAGAESGHDGLANTKAMAKAGSALAGDALAFEYEGRKDYYVASREEARLAYINAATPFPGGWWWTSTQHAGSSDWAWQQFFADGYQDGGHKSNSFPALLVRRIPVIR